MDTALFNLAKGPMLKELVPDPKLSVVVDGRLFTILLIGWSLGGLVFGVLGDRWGRVRTMAVTVLIYCLFTGLTAVCRSWQEVAGARFLTGLGLGGEWAAGAALLAEAFPERARAPGAGILQSAAAFGPWFAALLNLYVFGPGFAGSFPQIAPWRALFLVGIVPAALAVFVRLALKEPERWREAEKLERPGLWRPLAELFGAPKWRRHAIVALLLGFSGIAAANNLSYWLPNLVDSVTRGLSSAAVQDRKSYVTLAMHVGTLLGVLLVPWLCEKIGRRPTLALFLLLSPLSIVLATYGGGDYRSLLLLGPVMSFFTIGMSAAFVLYFPELFPTALRATGAGFAYNTGRILAAAVPLATAAIIGAGSVASGVAATALVPVVGLFALAFAPETRGQGLPDT